MKKGAVAKYIAALILVLGIGCGGTVAAGVYSNGFKSVRTRYAVADGAVVKNKGTVKVKDKDVTFELTGAGFKAVDWGNYAVTITANPKAAVTFEADGEAHSLDDTDITPAFNIVQHSNSFTLKKGEYDLLSVLKKLYGENVKLTDYNSKVVMYKMTVTSENGKKVEFYIDYDGVIVMPEGIELDPSEIIVG